MNKGSLKVDDSVWKALKKRLEELGKENAHVKVGVMGSSGMHPSGISLIELAAIHEFGSPAAHIPERSFIRSALRDNREPIVKFLQGQAKDIINDKTTPEVALGRLGLFAVTAIKKGITSKNIPPPLKPATVKRKGSSKPLVNDGHLLNAITWQVVMA